MEELDLHAEEKPSTWKKKLIIALIILYLLPGAYFVLTENRPWLWLLTAGIGFWPAFIGALLQGR